MLLGLEDNGSISGLTRANIEEWVMTTCRDQAPHGGARRRLCEGRRRGRIGRRNGAQMQQIEYVMRRGDRAGLSKYGGFQGATLRLIELRKLPQSKGASGASIDGYETWVSRRLRMLDAEL